MKIFISSVITGFETERAAVQDAIEILGHQVIRAEEFAASSESPRIACLAGVRASDLVVVIAGERYGHIQSEGLSATHEEFREARNSKDVLAFVQEGVPRDGNQEAFVREVEDWAAGGLTARFSSPPDLHRLAVRAISEHEKRQLRGAPNAAESLARAKEILGESDRHWRGEPALTMAVVGAPHQQIIRPRELESGELEKHISQSALFGPNALFERRQGVNSKVEEGKLILEQDARSIALSGDASIRLAVGIRSNSRMGAIIEEDVRDLLLCQLGFVDELLLALDASHRISHVCPVVRVDGGSHTAWRTRELEAQSPDSMRMSMFSEEPSPVSLQPGILARSSLRTQRQDIADDLLVLLRRQFAKG